MNNGKKSHEGITHYSAVSAFYAFVADLTPKKMKRTVFTLFLFLFTQTIWAQVAYFDTTFTEYFRRTSGWTAGDATISIPLNNGKVAWLFGDSYIDNVDVNGTVPCLFQVRNCMVLQDLSNLNSMTTVLDNSASGIHRTLFKEGSTVDTTVYWPNGGYVSGDTAILFFTRHRNSDLGFVGNYVFRYIISSSTLLPAELLPINDIGFLGNAVLYDSSSNYLYVYGSKLNWIVFEPYVLRVQANDLQGTWEYSTGNGNWSTNPGLAQKISTMAVSPGYSVFERNGKYYLITQQNGYLTCGLGLEIYSQFSTQPYGPFGNTATLYTIDDVYQGDTLVTYNGTAHPQFIDNNELLISYNVNGTVFDTTAPHICPSPCVNVWTDRMPADLYRPRFVRVPLSLIDISLATEPASENTFFSVFPNPILAGQYLQVQDFHGDLVLINALGHPVRQVHGNTVPTDGLPSGMYFLVGNTSLGKKLSAHVVIE
jgi:hypothetical protein